MLRAVQEISRGATFDSSILTFRVPWTALFSRMWRSLCRGTLLSHWPDVNFSLSQCEVQQSLRECGRFTLCGGFEYLPLLSETVIK